MDSNQAIRKIVGENIRKHRVLNHLTLDTLAKFMEVSPGFLGLIERGKRGLSFKNLFKLSEVLNVPLELFFVESGTDATENKSPNKSRSTRIKIMKKLDNMSEKELVFVLKIITSMDGLSDANEGLQN